MPAMPPLAEWTYVSPGDPMSSDVDKVRFLMQDTNPAVRLLTDLELQYLVDEWFHRYDTLIYVAAVAADRVAAKFAGVVSVSADGVSVGTADLSERYRLLATDLRALHKDYQISGEVDITNLMWDQNPDYGIRPLTFGVGMDDNLAAGRQDYGSQRGNDAPYLSDTVRPGG